MKSPILTHRLSQRLGMMLAAAAGWQVQIQPPPPRCVIIGAPHTSGWDLPLTLLMMLCGNLKLRWVGKHTLFHGPVGKLLRALGGIPVDRRSRMNVVDQMVAAFQANEQLMIAILPEGTRRRTAYWKTGFYYIELKAGVPIVMGYADYRRRIVGLWPVLHPSGDIAADFVAIRAFYADITGKYPDRQGAIEFRPTDEHAD
jgi:1-acyl-sn-glycerol-3-phosphate acyltransferase